MKEYDVAVVGAGDVGLAVAFKAASEGIKVCLIDKGYVGGTCVNRGCVPSKTLIHAADQIIDIRQAAEIGVLADIKEIDFKAIMNRMRDIVSEGRNGILKSIEQTENIDFYKTECRFIDQRVLDAGGTKITAKKFFIASGARPQIPPVKGLEAVPFLTNESVLDLEELPESIIIIGGGYVGVEYAHFFSALGSKVTVIDKGSRLLSSEDSDISETLMNELGKRIDMHLAADILEVRQDGGRCTVSLRVPGDSGDIEVSAANIMVATGRQSNADTIRSENAGIELDERNYIRVNDYMQTSRRHIWALGDAIGKAMFTHAGDKEAEIAWHNATQRKKIRMDFELVPHAVFTRPQIAAVGLTEELARKDHDISVGRAMYSDTVMGEAINEKSGFAKAVVEKNTGRILGFHIIGPHAAILVQEVVNAVINKSGVKSVTGCMHIFPALSNLIPEALGNLE